MLKKTSFLIGLCTNSLRVLKNEEYSLRSSAYISDLCVENGRLPQRSLRYAEDRRENTSSCLAVFNFVCKAFLILAFVFVCSVCSARAQDKKPSTPEQRKRVVEMITVLETNPFAKEAKEYRAALVYFVAEVPDIVIKLCTNVLGESKRVKGDYETEMVGQLMFSQTKFVIENPEKMHDDAAVYVAGVEGVLRTWQAIKTAKPKAKFPLLDELLEKQKAGTLVEYVQDRAKGCTSKQ